MLSKNKCYIYEEIDENEDGSDEDIDDIEGESDDKLGEKHFIDIQIQNTKKGHSLNISEATSRMLYDSAGCEEIEKKSTISIVPAPQILTTNDESLIMKAKKDLQVNFDLDNFQVQSLVSLLHGRNVVLISPCGSEKLLVFHMAVYILRLKFNLPNGVGVCLQPLNNILTEKTNNNPPLKTAYLTMTGDAVKEGNAVLSHSLEEIVSGEIGCLLGHAESFLSNRGMHMSSMFNNIQPTPIIF